MSRRGRRLAVVGLAYAVVLLAASGAARAAAPVLTLQAPPSIAVGTALEVDVGLQDASGAPLGGRPVELDMNGEPARRATTGRDGTVRVHLGRPSLGDLHLIARFPGDAGLAATSREAAVEVRPALLTITTVPATPDIRFTLDGDPFASGADGVARIEVGEPGTHALVAAVPEGMQLDATTRVDFLRWGDSEFREARDVTVSGDTALEVGLSLSRPVRLATVGLAGAPVPADRVTSIALKASNGTRYTMTDEGPHWLIANRIQRLRTGLVPTTLQYAVESVEVDGANVVNRFQQRYTVEPNATWTIELLLFGADLSATDALFGRPAGTGVLLRYPDGRAVTRSFDEGGVARFERLARGTYHVRVVGATGLAPLSPLALSRDQRITLKVLTALDIAVLVGAGLLFALGLLVLGRGVPRWRRRRAERASAPAPRGRAAVRPVPAASASGERLTVRATAPSSASSKKVAGARSSPERGR